MRAAETASRRIALRILLVTFVLPHRRAPSGAGVVVHGALAELSAHHDVTLVTFAAESADEAQALAELRALGVAVHELGGALPTSVIRWKRRTQHALARARGRTDVGMNSSDPRVQRLLDRLLREPRFDLLLVENIGVRYYRYETRAPSIVVEHEAGRVLLGDAEELQRRRPTIWRQFDRIQVFTPRDAAAVADIAPDLAGRVRVNPFGVDLPAPGGDTEEEAGTLLFVGGFRHWPNVDAAVWLSDEIMPLLRDLVPDARLQIVGNDPPQAVRALANGDIAVVGRVPDVEPYVRRAAVVLAPVRVGGGMRVKVLQAMALGKAVVTTPLGAEGLAPPDPDPPLAIASEAADFASATARLLGSPSERAALGRRARAFVLAHHSWPAYRRRLEAVHAELVERRPAPEPSHR